MTHAATIHVLRLPLLAVTTLALAFALALGTASPAGGFVDDTGGTGSAQPAQDDGFQPEGKGFVDPVDADASGASGAADGHDGGHGEVPPTASAPAAPTGGVAAGFGGTASDEAPLGAAPAVATGLLVLVTLGLAWTAATYRSSGASS